MSVEQKASIILVANCSATKMGETDASLCLRNHQGTLLKKFKNWTKSIARCQNTQPAIETYAGDAWGRIRRTMGFMPQNGQSWVLSAGLGLIPTYLEIPNYSATFASSSLDSVGTTRDENVKWWEMLQDWRMESNGIGNIATLASKNPKATIIACLSERYVSVIIDDLAQARSYLNSNEQLLVISAGYGADSRLGNSLLPIDAKFQNLVGGARSSLNARMTEFLIMEFKNRRMRSSSITEHLEAISKNLKPIVSYERLQMADSAIKTKIRDFVEQYGQHSASFLLRKFRDAGFACEQKRFRRLHEETIA